MKKFLMVHFEKLSFCSGGKTVNITPSETTDPEKFCISTQLKLIIMNFNKIRCFTLYADIPTLSSHFWTAPNSFIYNKYFVNKLAILFLYQQSFINNDIVNKIKCIYWFSYKIVVVSHKKKQVNVNFNLTQKSSWWINYSEYI